ITSGLLLKRKEREMINIISCLYFFSSVRLFALTLIGNLFLKSYATTLKEPTEAAVSLLCQQRRSRILRTFPIAVNT
ncbi:hypothetical protein, partial [Vitreoscilla massiliensis]|uniref:hypothetical protein n=1 Tax=Vitreoscilla massiliensis TaxID=1689272 RepID=UPI00071E65AE